MNADIDPAAPAVRERTAREQFGARLRPGTGRVATLVTLAKSLGSIALALVVASVVLALSGFGGLSLIDSLGAALTSNLGDTLGWSTVLTLTGLGTVIAFRARIWNIGLDGQLYVGALASTIAARWAASTVDPALGLTVCLVAGVAGGAVFAAIPAVLRMLWGAPEIVTTVIFITIGQLLVSYAIRGPLKSADPAVSAALTTDTIDPRLWLATLISGTQATVGVFAALAAVVILAVYLRKTRWGFEHRAYGANAGFSFYAGVNNRAVFLQTMLISGGLGGLAGALEVMGVFHNLTDGFDPSLGFTGIAVALVANNNELAVVLSAVFFGALQVAGNNLQLSTNAPPQFVSIVTGVVILMMTGRIAERWYSKLRRGRAAPPPAAASAPDAVHEVVADAQPGGAR
jgi:simple sugar transport system permease protein